MSQKYKYEMNQSTVESQPNCYKIHQPNCIVIIVVNRWGFFLNKFVFKTSSKV